MLAQMWGAAIDLPGHFVGKPWCCGVGKLSQPLVLDLDKEALKNAPGFEKDKWPDFADATFGRQIHEHYKTQPYWNVPALKS